MSKVTITIEIDDVALWSAVFGSNPIYFPWWRAFKYLGDTDWDKPGTVEILIANPSDDNYITKTITLDDILRAYEYVMNNPSHHCNGERVAQDLEDFDACEGDVILQVAMLGEVVYG